MSEIAPMLLIFAAPLVVGAVLIVFSRRGDRDEPRGAILGCGVALIIAAGAGLASVVVVQRLSAGAARHAEVEAGRAEEEAEEAITALIQQGNRLAAEAAAERDRAPAPLPESEPQESTDDEPATSDEES